MFNRERARGSCPAREKVWDDKKEKKKGPNKKFEGRKNKKGTRT